MDIERKWPKFEDRLCFLRHLAVGREPIIDDSHSGASSTVSFKSFVFRAFSGFKNIQQDLTSPERALTRASVTIPQMPIRIGVA